MPMGYHSAYLQDNTDLSLKDPSPTQSSAMYRNKSHYLAIIGSLSIVYSWTNTDLGGFSLIGESES